MSRIVIIGAGLTGISTAYHLEKSNNFDYILCEKENTVGGLCRSVHQEGYTFDYTGHLLHASDPYFSTLIHTIIGNDQFNSIDRRSFIYSHERYTPYPYQMHLQSLPTKVIAECIEGFIQRKKYSKINNFVEWVNHFFGTGFGRHFFIPYQKKIFACDPHTITASWTSRFVPQTSLHDIIDGLQGITKTSGYNASFIYPKEGGIVSWVHKFAQQLTNPILINHELSQIDPINKEITFVNGTTLNYDILVNTIPLDIFLGLLRKKSESTLRSAAHNLRCNSVTNFNIGIKDRIISNKHWIYFPEEQYAFYRLGFPHNFSDTMVPPGCSSLYGEFAHLNASQAWIEETTEKSIAQTKQLLNISEKEVATTAIISIPHAYVIYDHWREKNLNKILLRLSKNQIHSIGRYGSWKYSSMQEAVLEGKVMAQMIGDMPFKKPEISMYKTKKGVSHAHISHNQSQQQS